MKAWSKEIGLLLPDHMFEYCIYMYLRDKAHLYDQRFRFHGKIVTVGAGQVLTSYRDLAKFFNCNESKIRRAVRLLEEIGLVRLSSDHHHSVVTLVNHVAFLSDLERLMNHCGMSEVEAQQVSALMDSYSMSEEEAVRTIVRPRFQAEKEVRVEKYQNVALNHSDNHCITKNVDAVNIFHDETVEDRCDALNSGDNQVIAEICDAPRDCFDVPSSCENEQVTEMCDAESIDIKCNSVFRKKKDINIKNNSICSKINKNYNRKNSSKIRSIHFNIKDIQDLRNQGKLLDFLKAVKGNRESMSTEDFLELHEFVHRDEMNAVGATAIPIVSPIVWNKLGPVVL